MLPVFNQLLTNLFPLPAFSGRYMWRKRRSETLFGDPILIQSFWPDIKDGIDAAYEDADTGNITFFKGKIFKILLFSNFQN